MKKINPDFLLLIVAIIWGAGFVATEYAIDSQMSSVMILAGRFSIATIILLFFIRKERLNFKKTEWFHGSIAGALLFIGFLMQTYGQSQTTVSNSALLTATNVVFVPFITWAITKKRPETRIFFLTFFTFIGAAVLAFDFTLGLQINQGDFLIICCAIVFATYIAYLSIAVKNSNILRITFIQMLIASFLSIISMIATGDTSLSEVNLALAFPSVFYLGMFSTCLCFFLQNSAQQRTSPSKAGIILCTESLFGTVFSIILGLEPITSKVLIGGLIILTSVILTETNFSFNKARAKSQSA